MDCKASLVWAAQLFSNKSQTSLSVSALNLYHFHATVLDITKRVQRAYMKNENSVAMYVLLNFTMAEEIECSLRK